MKALMGIPGQAFFVPENVKALIDVTKNYGRDA
jgi:hypothetical protein